MVYAVVRAGGRQEKVEVGTIVVLDRQKAKAGEKLELPAVLFVDGDTVTTDADKLAKVTVTAEVAVKRLCNQVMGAVVEKGSFKSSMPVRINRKNEMANNSINP